MRGFGCILMPKTCFFAVLVAKVFVCFSECTKVRPSTMVVFTGPVLDPVQRTAVPVQYWICTAYWSVLYWAVLDTGMYCIGSVLDCTGHFSSVLDCIE